MEEIVVTWPESQDIMEKSGFKENARLINGEQGIEIYGSSAYLVDKEWLERPEEEWSGSEDYEQGCVYDDELQELGLL